MARKKPSKKYWYVVFVGACPGIYRSREEACRQVDGYQKQDWKRFDSETEAIAAFKKRSRSNYNPDKTFTWGYSPPRKI